MPGPLAAARVNSREKQDEHRPDTRLNTTAATANAFFPRIRAADTNARTAPAAALYHTGYANRSSANAISKLLVAAHSSTPAMSTVSSAFTSTAFLSPPSPLAGLRLRLPSSAPINPPITKPGGGRILLVFNTPIVSHPKRFAYRLAPISPNLKGAVFHSPFPIPYSL